MRDLEDFNTKVFLRAVIPPALEGLLSPDNEPLYKLRRMTGTGPF
jgi:hypothetical protein